MVLDGIVHVCSSFPAPASPFVPKRTSQGPRLQNGSHARVSPCHGFDQRNGSGFRIARHVSERFGLGDSIRLDSTRLDSTRRRAARATLHGRCCFCRSRTQNDRLVVGSRLPLQRDSYFRMGIVVLFLKVDVRSREECFTKRDES